MPLAFRSQSLGGLAVSLEQSKTAVASMETDIANDLPRAIELIKLAHELAGHDESGVYGQEMNGAVHRLADSAREFYTRLTAVQEIVRDAADSFEVAEAKRKASRAHLGV